MNLSAFKNELLDLTKEQQDKILILTEPVLKTFNEVIEQYKGAALFSLFDCVGTLALHCSNLADHVGLLMPLLAKKWFAFKNDDKRLLPLMECFEAVVYKLGPASEQYIEPVFLRCVQILQENLGENADGWANDFLVRSLNLIAAIIKGLQDKATQII